MRRPYGPGWALVGDAGLVMDPVTGQGIGHALRDAQSLSAAVVAGLSGQRPLAATLAAHHEARDAAVLPMYEFTLGLDLFNPGAILLDALARAEQSRVDKFLGAITGAVPVGRVLEARGKRRRLVEIRGPVNRLIRVLSG